MHHSRRLGGERSKKLCNGLQGDLLYLLHVVPERKFEVIGGDAAETIVSEDEAAEIQVVSSHPSWVICAVGVLITWEGSCAHGSIYMPYSNLTVIMAIARQAAWRQATV